MERGVTRVAADFATPAAAAPPINPPSAARTADVHWRIDGAATVDDATAPLVVCLHGWGMNEDWFARLLSRLFKLPAHFLIPRATLVAKDPSAETTEAAPPSDEARASWYEYDGDQTRFRAELARTESLFLSVIRDVEARFRWRPRERYLMGFSQGGYCGSVFALRHPELFNGLIVSGARVKTEILEEDVTRAGAAGMRALLLHGRRDSSVPMEAAERSRAALEAGGVDVSLQSFDAGHSLGREQLRSVVEWFGWQTHPEDQKTPNM